MQTIYIDGGSTAYGMFDTEKGGWAARMHTTTMLESANHMTDPTVVVNRSLPGRTVGAILRSVEEGMAPYVRQSRGDVVPIFQVGLNEAKIFDDDMGPIVGLAKFAQQLHGVCDIMDKNQLKPVLVGPQPINESLANPNPGGAILNDGLIKSYGARMQEVASERGLTYVNTRELLGAQNLDEVLADDGYHPNALGHMMLYRAIAAEIGI